jgi:hypothetical protein
VARASRQPSARARARHGRLGRSPVTGPHLPLAHTRRDLFDTTVQASAEYLMNLWPDELAQLSITVVPMPDQPPGPNGVERWRVAPEQNLVVLYRIPIERMSHLHREDDWHRRLMVESCVFRAVGELIGKDPWELAPDRFRHW